MIGTVIMTAGMFGRAYLVGQITQEKRWKRRGRDPTNSAGPARTRLYWVQPGDQVIGDQTFGAYAYSEDPRQPLPEYVISTKKEEGKTLLRYRFLTWIAVIATLGGYILQFVGIRGMTAWVSIAQLGATVIMSVFRAMMRTQRLANNGNRVQDISGAIAGHELDWLAFEIWKDMEAEQHRHQQGGGREERRDSTAREDGKTVGVSWVFTGRPCSDGKMAPTELNHAEDILRIRARLAYLSGHNSAFQSEKEKPRRQQWDNKYVPARDRAVKMAKALGQIADRIIDKNHPREKEIHLHFQVQFWRSAGGIKVETYPITIILYPPKPTAGRRGWSLDSQQLEAILGLYSWSLYRYREVNETPRGSWWLGAGSKLLHGKSEIDLAGDVQRAQILSSITPVGIDDQYLLDLWLGDNTPDIKSCTIKWDQTDHPDATTIWTKSPVRTEIQFPNGRPEFVFTPGKSDSSDNGPNISSDNHLRFFGWSHVHHEPDFQAEEREADIYYVETNRSVLDDCAHDIFSAILSELKRQPPSTVRLLVPHGNRGLVPKPSSPPTDWQSDLLSSLTTALKDNNMGSHQDALLGILPALCTVLAKPVRQSCIMMFMAIRYVTEYRKRGQWRRSWRILRTVYMTGDFWNHYMISEVDVYLRNATITSLCELFCSSLQYGQEECRRALFGFEGMKWLQEVCQTWWADENRATRNRKVLDLSKQQNSLTVYCYSLIARHIMTIRVSSRPGEKGHRMLPPWQGYMPWRFMENPRDMNPRFLNFF
ncbi:hypothetical protein N656DRAFT_73866 [Canariomyces notabilis]|uniref:Uncharacterized protein n=1 Tax=Canariomyces notabilis TaxID=2074819 RepID=A0AAN6TF90_9PEZI|nr:hypothetical protein N656DRAFT_73866 [Canariomyces arenarius]